MIERRDAEPGGFILRALMAYTEAEMRQEEAGGWPLGPEQFAEIVDNWSTSKRDRRHVAAVVFDAAQMGGDGQ